MEKSTIITRLLAMFTLVLTGILAVGEKTLAAFFAGEITSTANTYPILSGQG